MDESSQAFVRYLRPHWRRLHRMARRYMACEEDALDLVQETLLRAWRAFSPTEDRASRRAWLFFIMRNVVIDWRRAAAMCRIGRIGAPATPMMVAMG
jgi:RNA polymerase sigma-70 factor (ECF subfamily)